MESKPEEEKKNPEQEVINPSLDLKKAMEELGINPKEEGFTREVMVARFEEEMAKPGLEFWQRDRLKHLITITGKHKFWET